jgi:hypothetical protein
MPSKRIPADNRKHARSEARELDRVSYLGASRSLEALAPKHFGGLPELVAVNQRKARLRSISLDGVFSEPVEMISQVPCEHVMLSNANADFARGEKKDSIGFKDSIDLAEGCHRANEMGKDVDHRYGCERARTQAQRFKRLAVDCRPGLLSRCLASIGREFDTLDKDTFSCRKRNERARPAADVEPSPERCVGRAEINVTLKRCLALLLASQVQDSIGLNLFSGMSIFHLRHALGLIWHLLDVVKAAILTAAKVVVVLAEKVVPSIRVATVADGSQRSP